MASMRLINPALDAFLTFGLTVGAATAQEVPCEGDFAGFNAAGFDEIGFDEGVPGDCRPRTPTPSGSVLVAIAGDLDPSLTLITVVDLAGDGHPSPDPRWSLLQEV